MRSPNLFQPPGAPPHLDIGPSTVCYGSRFPLSQPRLSNRASYLFINANPFFPSMEQAERPVTMGTIRLHLYEWAILQAAEKSLTSSRSRADSGTKQTKFLSLSNRHGEINSHTAATSIHSEQSGFLLMLSLSIHSQISGIQQAGGS